MLVRPRRALLLTGALTATLLLTVGSLAHACTGVLSAGPTTPGEVLPPTGPEPGTSLAVSGTDFLAGPVVLHWGTADGPVLGEAIANERGEFSAEIVVPDRPEMRQRIIAESTAASENGAPAVGWVDLVEPETPATAPAPAASVDSGRDLTGAAAVMAVVVLAAVAAAVQHRRRRRRLQLDEDISSESANIDEALAELLASEEELEAVNRPEPAASTR